MSYIRNKSDGSCSSCKRRYRSGGCDCRSCMNDGNCGCAATDGRKRRRSRSRSKHRRSSKRRSRSSRRRRH